jgi:transcriptional regulator with XRE-family HTH domain
MEVLAKHWTANSTDGFVYRISSDFVLQLEKKMNGEVSQNDLARRLKVSKGRVSQVLNNPGNLTLKKMVQYSRALGMKVAIVAYDDGDPTNQNGPINSEIFFRCWQKHGSPRDFFALNAPMSVVRTVTSLPFLIIPYQDEPQSAWTAPNWTAGYEWQQTNLTTTHRTALIAEGD